MTSGFIPLQLKKDEIKGPKDLQLEVWPQRNSSTFGIEEKLQCNVATPASCNGLNSPALVLAILFNQFCQFYPAYFFFSSKKCISLILSNVFLQYYQIYFFSIKCISCQAAAMVSILQRWSWHTFSIVTTRIGGHANFAQVNSIPICLTFQVKSIVITP